MEKITTLLKKIVLSEAVTDEAQNEIDVIETIFAIEEKNLEETKGKIMNYLVSHGRGRLQMIVSCIGKACVVRPKERETIAELFSSLKEKFEMKDTELTFNDIELRCVLEQKGLIPTKYHDDFNAFTFGEEGTIERAIFNDDIDELQHIVASQSFNVSETLISIYGFFRLEDCFPADEPILTLLDEAALFGSVKCFKYLLLNGVEISKDTCCYAIAGGNNEIVHLCEQKGMKFEHCLINAIKYHRFDLFEWLILHFSNDRIDVASCFEYCNEPAIYYYIHCGGKLQGLRHDKTSTLHLAASSGLIEMIKYLLDEGLDIDIKNIKGCTPLMEAVHSHNFDAVKLLVDQGANIDATDESGLTALFYATGIGITNHIYIEYLISKGTDIKIRSKNDSTLLHFAAKYNNQELVKYCISKGFDVNAQDAEGTTPLHLAASTNSFASIKLLIENGAIYNMKNKLGITPLMEASNHGHYSIIAYLNNLKNTKR